MLQLRDIASQLLAGARTTQESTRLSLPVEPPTPHDHCPCSSQTLPKQRVPWPARLDQHQGPDGAPWLLGPHCHTALGSLGTGRSPQSWGVHGGVLDIAQWRDTPPPHIHHPEEGTPTQILCMDVLAVPSSRLPSLLPCGANPAVLDSRPHRPCPILLLQAFPGLAKPLNQALAATMCCLLALAGAHSAESCHLLCTETHCGSGTRDVLPTRGPSTHGHPAQGSGQRPAGPRGSMGSCFTQPRGEQEQTEFGISLDFPTPISDWQCHQLCAGPA